MGFCLSVRRWALRRCDDPFQREGSSLGQWFEAIGTLNLSAGTPYRPLKRRCPPHEQYENTRVPFSPLLGLARASWFCFRAERDRGGDKSPSVSRAAAVLLGGKPAAEREAPSAHLSGAPIFLLVLFVLALTFSAAPQAYGRRHNPLPRQAAVAPGITRHDEGRACPPFGIPAARRALAEIKRPGSPALERYALPAAGQQAEAWPPGHAIPGPLLSPRGLSSPGFGGGEWPPNRWRMAS